MKHLTRSTAKPMLCIKGRPILEHKINALPKKIKEIIFIVGYQGGHVLTHFKRYFNGRRIIYVFQTNLNGTGGALHLAKSILKDKFLVLMGDDLYHKKDLEELIKNDLAVLAYEVSNPGDFGVIKTNRSGHMIDIIEAPHKTRHKLANTGVYVLNKKFFEYDLISKKPGDKEFGLPQTMAQMARDHKIKVTKARAWHPIGNPEDLKEAEKILHNFL